MSSRCSWDTWTRYFPCKGSAHSPASLLSCPGIGHTNLVAQTQDSPGGVFNLKKCHLPLAPPQHSSPLSKHICGHSWKTIAGNPCAARTHFQDPPPRKPRPRHQLPREVLLPSADPLAPFQPLTEFSSPPAFLKSTQRLASLPIRDATFSLCS